MSIEIIAIGNELLFGHVINTNATFISRELAKEGFIVSRHLVIDDQYDLLVTEFKKALQRSQIVIVTGGLGPTLDDLTRQAAAIVFESGFHYDEEIGNDLKRRYGENFPTLVDQATIPDKAFPLKNPYGTAPGLVFSSPNSALILLPGVPLEMEPMLQTQVIPFLKKQFFFLPRKFQRNLHLFNLSEAMVDPTLRRLQKQFPEIDYCINPSQGLLSIRLAYQDINEEEALKKIELPFKILKDEFLGNSFVSENGKIEEAIHETFIKKKLTLSTAESCTGGAIATRLTRLSGASQYFLGSIVSYSNELKTQLLGVNEKLLKEKGAVSEEVVSQMAKSMLDLTGSDFSIAISGVAGPTGGTPEKPVGTVFGAVCRKSHDPRVIRYFIPRSRAMIIERTSNLLLSELLQEVLT